MARDARFKVVVRNQGKGPNEFYDLKADPREKVNGFDNPQYVTVRDYLMKDSPPGAKTTPGSEKEKKKGANAFSALKAPFIPESP